MSQDKEVMALVADIGKAVEAMKSDSVQINAELKKSVDATSKDAAKAIASANDLAEKVQAQASAMQEMEQKLVDRVKAGKASPQSLGDMFVSSDAFKRFADGLTNKARIEANTITGQSGSPAANNDTMNASQRLNGIVGGAFRTLRVMDVLPQGVTNSNIVEYTKESTFTNSAAETAEGAAKPESTLEFTLASAPVRTIAHFLKASKQVLEDAPALQSFIDVRLRYGVDLKLETQLIAGTGSSQQISGITASGNYTAFTPTTGDTAIDSINRAIELVALADYNATAIMLNPANWYAISRLKDSQNQYLFGAPSDALSPRLWGLPVVVSNSITANKLIVGAFDISHQVFMRSGTVVEMFEQDSDNAQKNLVTIRAENRATLATFRAASVYYGNLTV